MNGACMNRIVIFLLFALCFSGCVKNIYPQLSSSLPERAHFLVDEQQKLSRPLIELMRLTATPVAHDLPSAVSITQKSWLRKPDNERSDMVEEYAANKDHIRQQFSSLGLLEEITPQRMAYSYVLVLGATYEAVKERLSYLERLLEDGCTVKTIVFLGSERPLTKQEVAELASKNYATMPRTEIEMMKAVYGSSKVLQYRAPKIIPLSSSMKVDRNGNERRANTYDTLIDFQKLNMVPGSVLVISSQPHILRQDLVVRGVLKEALADRKCGP